MHNPQQRAFSLPELLVTLTLLAILASIAIPNSNRLIESNQQQALGELLLRSLQLARARAVTEKRTLLICPSSNSSKCGSDWNEGWILKSAAHDEVLSQDKFSGFDGNLYWSGYRKEIHFRSDGTSPTGNGRFYLCVRNGLAWQLVINRQGRIRLTDAQENAKDTNRCG